MPGCLSWAQLLVVASTLERVVIAAFFPTSQALARPQQFGELPAEERRCVLLGLWYALNWCRELVNCFGSQLGADG